MVKDIKIPNNIDDICELFGECELLTDINWNYKAKSKTTRYYLGEIGDTSVGIWLYALTPVFRSQKALERYCKSTKGRLAINEEAGKIFTDWDKDKQEWKR